MFFQPIVSLLILSILNNPALSTPSLRISNGDVAKIIDYPYQVSIQTRNQHICGGAIIAENQILTGALCAYKYTPEELSVRAGSSVYEFGGQLIKVKSIVANENFNLSTLDYDLAVLELSENIVLDETKAIVALPENNYEVPVGTVGKIAGWGAENDVDPEISSILRSVEVPIVDHDQCDAAYGGFVTQRMICAGYQEGGKDACTGDAGSPLVVNNTIIGIASWGSGCGEEGYPGVYTNVASLVDSIKDILKN